MLPEDFGKMGRAGEVKDICNLHHVLFFYREILSRVLHLFLGGVLHDGISGSVFKGLDKSHLVNRVIQIDFADRYRNVHVVVQTLQKQIRIIG